MQKTLDGKTVADTLQISLKIKPLRDLKMGIVVNEKKLIIDSLKLFNRLIIISEREVATQENLKFELTAFPMSIFNKHQKMRKTDKSDFGKFLKSLVTPVE